MRKENPLGVIGSTQGAGEGSTAIPRDLSMISSNWEEPSIKFMTYSVKECKCPILFSMG